MPKPTKAESEFEGDCFGVEHSVEAEECKGCSVNQECLAATLRKCIKAMDSLPSSRGRPLNMNKTELGFEIIKSFTSDFTLEEFRMRLRAAIRDNGSHSWNIEELAKQIVFKAVKDGIIERIENGRYSKPKGDNATPTGPADLR